MSVIVTDTAAREISSILSQQGLDSSTTHLRIGVKGGGCSGFNYILDLTETKKEGDEQWDFDLNSKANHLHCKSSVTQKVIFISMEQQLISKTK